MNTCPACGFDQLKDPWNEVGERGPEPNDFSVCTECAAVLRFNHDLSLRTCTQDEVEENLGPLEREEIDAARRQILGRKGRI